MGQIGIGINENVYLSKIEQDPQSGAILITFNNKDDETGGNGPVNYFEMLGADKLVDPSQGLTIRVFAPNEPKADKTIEQRVQFAFNDILSNRQIIEHLMEGYMREEEASAGKIVFANTGLDQQNFDQKIITAPILKVVHNNLARHFLQGMKPFVGRRDLLFRLLLVAQNRDKPFASFRKRYLKDNPIWESMDVPREMSKLAFTKYELKEGLDKDQPLPPRDSADPKGPAGPVGTPTAPLNAGSVFNSGMFG
jgi:hypothetical protein